MSRNTNETQPLKELSLQVLEQAKADLSCDKHLIPVAFVITDIDVSDFALTFDDPEESNSSTRSL
jgi:hypothetical protein